MLNLSFKNFKGIPIFLELAPEGLLSASKINTNVAVPGNPSPDINVKTLFVKNLSFSSTKQTLEQHFGHLNGFVSAKVCHRPDPKNPKEILMLGFGFVEFTSNALALKAMDVMQVDTLIIRYLNFNFSRGQLWMVEDCKSTYQTAIRRIPSIVPGARDCLSKMSLLRHRNRKFLSFSGTIEIYCKKITDL